MKLRTLIGSQAGAIRDYSPSAARGALASGMAERTEDRPLTRVRTAVLVAESEKQKLIPSRRKG